MFNNVIDRLLVPQLGLCCAVLLTVGCGINPRAGIGQHETGTVSANRSAVEKEEITEAVRREIEKRGWTDYEIDSVHQVGDSWRAMVWFLPKTPGSHVFVDIAANGEVTIYPGA